MDEQNGNKLNLNIYCDGGSRGNPGPSAIGVVVYDVKKQQLVEISKYIGHATNNIAEYSAVIEAYEWLNFFEQKNQIEKITFYLDSNLLVNQLMGRYKVKDQKLRILYTKIKQLENRLATFMHPVNSSLNFTNAKISLKYIHIPREQNKKADSLVNYALDKHVDI